MLSAGLTSGITDTVGLGGTLLANAKVAQRATFTLQHNLVRTTVNAGVSTAIQGGKLDKALLNAMRTAATSTIGEIAANEIGAAYSQAAANGKDIGEYLVHKAAHAGLGCATAAIGNRDCGSGALGGAAGAVVSKSYQAITQPQLTEELNDLHMELSGQNLSDAEIDARLNAQFQDWSNRGVDLSKLSAGLLAAASGEPFTEAQLRNVGLQLGIDVALGVTFSKLKILEASYKLAVKAGDKIGTTKLAKYISDFEIRSEGVGSFPGNVRVGRKSNNSTDSSDKLLWSSWNDYPKVIINGREYAQISGRNYSHHAVNRMQPSSLGTPVGADGPGRNVTPNMVEDVIINGTSTIKTVGGVERIVFTTGNVSVVTENGANTIVTILRNSSQ